MGHLGLYSALPLLVMKRWAHYSPSLSFGFLEVKWEASLLFLKVYVAGH